jgi:hypothetical protein
MNSYRITKYNPAKRDSNGYYADDKEWTSISDIGDSKFESFSYDDYKRIEDGYALCINLLMKEYKAFEFIATDVTNIWKSKDIAKDKQTGRLRDLEVDFEKDIKPIIEGVKISETSVEYYSRLCLREVFQMKLINPKLEIEFGFDYYMYVTCPKIPENIVSQIEKNFLFVEEDNTRKEIIFEG